MSTALEAGVWSAACPGRTLPPGKTRYPLYRRLGGPKGLSGRAENLAPPGFDPRTAQPVVSRYTDWATQSTKCLKPDCIIRSGDAACRNVSILLIFVCMGGGGEYLGIKPSSDITFNLMKLWLPTCILIIFLKIFMSTVYSALHKNKYLYHYLYPVSGHTNICNSVQQATPHITCY